MQLLHVMLLLDITLHQEVKKIKKYNNKRNHSNFIFILDAFGNVRIWDTTQKEHPLKLEIKVIAGEIKDIAWDSESKRIIAVGNGQEKFVFLKKNLSFLLDYLLIFFKKKKIRTRIFG